MGACWGLRFGNPAAADADVVNIRVLVALGYAHGINPLFPKNECVIDGMDGWNG